jgi:periplasmic divalent cation tolerance protein
MFVVITTTGSIEEARRLASLCVERKFAGCVQIIPAIESVYEWKGEIKNDGECLLMIKSIPEKFPEIERFLKAEHPYELPEIIGFSTDYVSDEYAKWLRSVID